MTKEGHLFIADTAFSELEIKNNLLLLRLEKSEACDKLGVKVEITRFKGLGEISPNEFKNFIGDSIRLDPVIINKETSVDDLLSFYGEEYTEQNFIIDNLS